MDVRFEAAAVDPLMAIAPARAADAAPADAPNFDDHLAAQAEPERAEPQTTQQADDAPPQTDTPTMPVVIAAPPQTPVMTPRMKPTRIVE